MKDNFEVDAFCNSKYCSSNQNMLARIQNAMALGFNRNPYLPKYVIFVLDEDILNYVRFEGLGTCELVGMFIQWILKQLLLLIEDKRRGLPGKAIAIMSHAVIFCMLRFTMICQKIENGCATGTMLV